MQCAKSTPRTWSVSQAIYLCTCALCIKYWTTRVHLLQCRRFKFRHDWPCGRDTSLLLPTLQFGSAVEFKEQQLSNRPNTSKIKQELRIFCCWILNEIEIGMECCRVIWQLSVMCGRLFRYVLLIMWAWRWRQRNNHEANAASFE